MNKVAVIIKHPFRNNDWRVDIYEVPENITYEEIKKHVESKMLGHFEVVGISDRISFDRKIPNKR